MCSSDLIIEPLTAAQLLKALADREQPMLAILGKQAIDDDCSQTGQMLAALWQRPQATFASKVEVDGETARVTREVEGAEGLVVVEGNATPVEDHGARASRASHILADGEEATIDGHATGEGVGGRKGEGRGSSLHERSRAADHSPYH